MNADQFDIYISYAPEDRDFVQRLAEELEWMDLRVWWKNQPTTSQESLDVLGQCMDQQHVHLVVWSMDSAASGRVQAEARLSSQKGRLIAARIEALLPPKGTKAIAYGDLSDWRGGTQHSGMRRLLAGVYKLIGKGMLPELAEEVSKEVAATTEYDQLTEEEKDARAWQTCLAYDNQTYYKHYLQRFPKGKHVEEAKEQLAKKKRTGSIILGCAILFSIAYLIFYVAINLQRF